MGIGRVEVVADVYFVAQAFGYHFGRAERIEKGRRRETKTISKELSPLEQMGIGRGEVVADVYFVS